MKIAIIGAGPAGLIAARNAVKDGFNVVLFEKLARERDLEPLIAVGLNV
jgi:dimethylaniline monooxygenase (N-oxide forming)